MSAPDTPVMVEIHDHPSVDPVPVRGGEVVLGGIPLGRLAARVGSTPFFAYDRGRVTDRVRQVRTAFEGVSIGYAVKANPMPALVQHLAGLVDNLDVASAAELRTALDTGMSPSRITFAGPGKTPGEIGCAVAAGTIIEIESETEARRVIAAGESLSIAPQVAVRVNPDFPARGSGMRMGGGPQQFGVDSEKVPDLLRLLANAGVPSQGFHVFTGSQNLDADAIVGTHRATAELLVALARSAPEPVRYLNLGGGLGIPYFPKDRPIDLTRVGAGLAETLHDVLRPALPGATVHLEFGRYLVGEAGYYVTRVVDRKTSRGRTYLVVDGGMHHQLAASGNLGQVFRRNYPVLVGSRACSGDLETVFVVGCLCTPLDLLADEATLPRAEVGDLIVVLQSGAYGRTASPAGFLSHPAPVEVLV